MNIPNLPISPMVNAEGYPTDVELNFRQNLIQVLQLGAGNEGLVMPTVSPTQLTTIQNNQNAQGQFTCQLGTMLYVQHPSDYTQDKVVISVRTDNTYPATAPLFKKVTLT